MYRSVTPFLMSGLVALAMSRPSYADDHQARAEQLSSLRAEVEALSEQLTAAKDADRSRLRAIEAQRVDLEVQIRRQELRLERLLSEETERLAAIEAEGGGDDAVRDVVGTTIDALRREVRRGLPFKAELRLSALDELEGKLAAGVLSAEQAAARVWAFAEDERRLSRENVLDRQVISLDGEEVLVDVARLGMVAMYWRAPDGRVGQSRRSESGWTQKRLESAQAEQVEILFDSLAKGIRSGVFELPGLLAEVEK